MQNETQAIEPKKTIVFIIESCIDKGLYPFERVSTLARLLTHEKVVIFIKSPSNDGMPILIHAGLSPIVFNHFNELPQQIKEIQPDLIVRDGRNSEGWQVQNLRPYCKAIIHFDDFGEGGQACDCVLLALYQEVKDYLPSHYIGGSFVFALPEIYQQFNSIPDRKIAEDPPHIVVAFEDGDEHNLTYRTLRHLTQLQIPLQITVMIDDCYRHATDDLQMMVLSRRNTAILRDKNALLQLLPKADVIICNANYTPYKIASYGVPCITLAQSEAELLHAFPREQNGFIHLGLGRKMKQSQIQNAVMELLLHEARSERAIRKQRQLNLANNNETLQTLLLDFAYDRHNIAST
ncbi:CMP-N-acetylneuraminic acid synthetase [Lysinibacillus macroides]|uniref:CMP-N-acetylneuraminic acid synthetase n=1 Tax=Lysinibacillus macroides TaxID=33935 RepID=A0A0M9DLU7_9BACI|nr:CMP-N-acetylneuraminic acid synthetase [Lysinibacillus macroides]KOY84058.1 CMP-N-acetylneuraminic acid synthetase [Lysinibacillus macroides]QPR66827.1 CMP-N-acetylneuraminic acid synthetase [Lysinibacillus macroides]